MSRSAELHDYGYMPSRAETVLLRCIVLREAIPFEVINVIADRNDTSVNSGVARLFPLLRDHPHYSSLPRNARERISILHRENTYHYFFLKSILHSLIARLAECSISVMLLKGFPLATLYYPSVGGRPMADIDIAVRPARFEAALRALEQGGFSEKGSRAGLPRGSQRHALALRDIGGIEVDLHRHVLYASRWSHADDAFWAGAVPFPIRDLTAITLGPADHLLHACIHGVRWNVVSPVRWIVDCAFILERGNLDWGRLIEQARHHGCAGPLLACLRYLREHFELSVPSEVVQDLTRVPYTEASDRYFRRVGHPSLSHGGLRYRLERLAVEYRRYTQGQAATTGGAPGPGLLDFLTARWDLDGWRAVPGEAIRRLMRSGVRRGLRARDTRTSGIRSEQRSGEADRG